MAIDLQARIERSVYLSSLQQKLAMPALTSAAQLKQELEKLCKQISADPIEDEDLAAAELRLVQAKSQFNWLWCQSELGELFSPGEGGLFQAMFADVSIDFALRLGWRRIAQRHVAIAKQLGADGSLPGLFIFGMGKLGGQDLNFSSDVDLVAYFDPDTLPVAEMLGQSFICHQVLQEVTRVLGRKGASDFIWRVDWRLRPNASATTLAMSVHAAQDYYFYRASPWHRLALLKARVVAGDEVSGKQFLNSLAPFVWRQNLDYRAIDELAEIKQKINLEHPSLRLERRSEEAIADSAAGFNLKLGTGGIREIEFVVNALQLIWGGKQYALRTTNTMQALDALAAAGHLQASQAEQLAVAYQDFRRLENAVQMLENQQSHHLPLDDGKQRTIAMLFGSLDWPDLCANIKQHRTAVHTLFEGLFAEQQSDQLHSFNWPSGLSAAAKEIVEDWENGFHQYGVASQRQHRLRPLAAALANYLGGLNQDRDPDASATVLRLHDFFRSLPRGEQYFRLLARSPVLLENIVMPLLYSPPMSKLLKQSPHIIDCYMQEPWQYPQQGFDSDYVFQAEQYEVQLERLRRFVNEYLYQLYLWFLRGEMKVAAFQSALTHLAEHTLEVTLRLVGSNLDLAETPIVVIGLGKLGLRRMSPTSDLDLVFVFDGDQTSLEMASRFVSRLQTAISTPMREGIVYELDTRLRPSGKSGAPTVSLESFANHQMQRAHNWEHISLVPARPVAGNTSLFSGTEQVLQSVLAKPRDPQQFLRDASKMWQRIAEHRVVEHNAELMFAKLRPGGLMQAEYLANCKILQQGTYRLEADFDGMLGAAVENSDIEYLAEIIQFWRIQQLWERLLGHHGNPIFTLPADSRERLLHHSGVTTPEQLIEKKIDYAATVEHAMHALFAEIDDVGFDSADWLETNVVWR